MPKKMMNNHERRSALAAAWEQFLIKMDRIRTSARAVMRRIDDKRRAREIEDVRKKLNEL